MDSVFIICSLMFVVQIVTNVIVLVKILPMCRYKRAKPKMSDIVSTVQQPEAVTNDIINAFMSNLQKVNNNESV